LSASLGVKVRGYLSLIRVVNSMMVGLAVLVGTAIVLGEDILRVPASTILAGFLTGFFISSSSMVLNDIVDVEIDRINRRNRPLVTGIVTVEEAYALYAVTSLLGVYTAMALGCKATLLAAGAWLLGTVYDVWGKVSGLPGNIMVALATSLPFPFAMAMFDRWTPTITVFWMMVFLSVLGREIAKDIIDVEGDRSAGAKTIPVILGERVAALAAATLYLTAVALSVLPILWGTVNAFAYAPLVAVVDLILVYESLRIIRDHSRETLLTHKKRVLVAMLLGLLAFLLGSLG